MNLAETLLHALKERGAREVFGIPGDFALPFFKVIEDSGILPLYTLSHEPGVGFAADASARISTGLGVAAVTYGAGAFNMVNPVAGAFAEKSPLVVISGAPGAEERTRGLLLHHQAKTLDSQLAVFAEMTCDQAVLDDVARAPARIARVLDACLEQSRPVYIELPRDMVGVAAEPVPPPGTRPIDAEAVAACADEILGRLRGGSRPAVLAGVELRRFGLEDKVADLARRLGLPVATSFMGRGLLTTPGTPLVGTYMGLAGDADVTETIEGSDALLMLGVLLSDTNFGVSERNIDRRHAMIACDGEVRVGHHVYPDVPLAALIDALMAGAPKVRRKKVPARTPAAGGLVADDNAVTPKDIAQAVNDMFDAHGHMPIASDMGDCLFTAMDIRHTPMVAPGYYATMGFGVPAGLGLQATTGERPLILVGDGAFQMTGWELGNCARYGWDPIVVVFNNAAWEMLRSFQPGASYNDLEEWDFAAIADTLGGTGQRVTTRRQLRDALKKAVSARGRFQLVDVILEPNSRSSVLGRFVSAIQRGHPVT